MDFQTFIETHHPNYYNSDKVGRFLHLSLKCEDYLTYVNHEEFSELIHLYEVLFEEAFENFLSKK